MNETKDFKSEKIVDVTKQVSQINDFDVLEETSDLCDQTNDCSEFLGIPKQVGDSVVFKIINEYVEPQIACKNMDCKSSNSITSSIYIILSNIYKIIVNVLCFKYLKKKIN
jgi:hypothetical protein